MSPWANALSDADLFWSKVDRSGECWMWQGALNNHGYGRVIVGQELWLAHRLAWFMVMGKMPEHGLYHIGPQGGAFSRVNPGAINFRRCVRPHHFRDGPGENAKSRWAAKARSGWPPEFRGVVDKLMSTEQAGTDLMPLLLYRGSLTAGRAQAMFNFTLAAQAAEAERLGDIVAMSRSWPDVAHTVGLHKPVSAVNAVGQFWGRMLDNPSTMALRPGLRDYIRGTLNRSEYRPVRGLERIPRHSQWSTRRWRKPPRPVPTPKARPVPYEPVPIVWPFIPGQATDEHDLILAVDALVPKTLPEDIRQDVCQDLILSVLDGSVQPENLRDATSEHIKAVWRQHPSKYGMLSLDADRPGTDGFTLLDTLADAPLILAGEQSSLAALRDRLLEQEAAA